MTESSVKELKKTFSKYFKYEEGSYVSLASITEKMGDNFVKVNLDKVVKNPILKRLNRIKCLVDYVEIDDPKNYADIDDFKSDYTGTSNVTFEDKPKSPKVFKKKEEINVETPPMSNEHLEITAMINDIKTIVNEVGTKSDREIKQMKTKIDSLLDMKEDLKQLLVEVNQHNNKIDTSRKQEDEERKELLTAVNSLIESKKKDDKTIKELKTEITLLSEGNKELNEKLDQLNKSAKIIANYKYLTTSFKNNDVEHEDMEYYIEHPKEIAGMLMRKNPDTVVTLAISANTGRESVEENKKKVR